MLVFGVAVGVFIFMAALIGGLAEFIMARTAGDMAHITIQAAPVDPSLLLPRKDQTILPVQEASTQSSATLKNTAALLPLIEALPGVIATSQQISGSGFLTRGAQVSQVSINGLEPGKESAIANLAGYITQGSANPGTGGLLLGKTLAEDMNLQLGQTVRLQSSGGIEALLTIIIGVASTLLLSTYRRRPEIGIMRVMGAGRWFVVVVFVSQGGLIGLMGGLFGVAAGYGMLLAFPGHDSMASGSSGLPIDIAQGAYGLAIVLTTLGAILASILPARAGAVCSSGWGWPTGSISRQPTSQAGKSNARGGPRPDEQPRTGAGG